jgi:[ribosomal protein S18]-alanine N-acetyltransferase
MRTMMKTRLRPMADADIAQVADIERESFPSMWPQTAYRRELSNKIARYFVVTELRDEAAGTESPASAGILGALRRVVGGSEPSAPSEYLLGFIGLWLMVNEAHIVTVAVREQYRRSGIGERLLIAAIELAMDADQEVVTLEVRASNDSAIRMYEKYGFSRVGLRKRYYTDNNEDAAIMTTPDIFVPTYRRLLAELKEQHQARYPDLWS